MDKRPAVLIPYSYRTDGYDKLMMYVVNTWRRDFNAKVFIGSSSEPFNRSVARNDAALQAREYDTYIFCDADTVYENLHDIAVALRANKTTWFTCDKYKMLSQNASHAYMHGERSIELELDNILDRPPGGMLICQREQFDAVGGFDPNFIGWGYEDTAFVKAMTEVHGPPEAFGNVLHLWHPKERRERQRQPMIAANKRRYGWYDAASGPDEMLALIKRLRTDLG